MKKHFWANLYIYTYAIATLDYQSVSNNEKLQKKRKKFSLLHLHSPEDSLQLSEAHHAPRFFREAEGLREDFLDGALVLAIGMEDSAIEVVHGHGT